MESLQEDLPDVVMQEITARVQECFPEADSCLMMQCPKCGKTQLIPFTKSLTYDRSFIHKIDNLVLKVPVVVYRMVCENCSSTHALLPCFCIPYSQYSTTTVLETVHEASSTSPEEVATKLSISPAIILNLIILVESFISYFDFLLHEMNVPIKEDSTLFQIIDALPPDIIKIYYQTFQTPFLYKKRKRKLYVSYKELSF